MSRLWAAPAALLGAALLTGCSHDLGAGPDTPSAAEVRTVLPESETTVVDGAGAVELAIATSRAIFESAPVVVLVGEADPAAQERAGRVAVDLGVPLLVTPAPSQPAPTDSSPAEPAAVASPSLAPVGLPGADPLTEIVRIGAHAAVPVGEAAAQWARTLTLPPSVVVATADDPAVRDVRPAPALASLLVIAPGAAADAAAVVTARAAGARVLVLGATDPRATGETVRAVAGAGPIDKVLAVGSAFGPPELLRQRLATAATGVELPGGGQLLFPGRRMVALYGHPGDGGGLGVLGEQPLDASIARARDLAASYQAFVGEPVVPAFEIIASVASGTTGSFVHPVDKFRPWVQAARDAGVYVLLDLQPGDAHFLTQAQYYAELLLEPNVGLALDPEWRVQPGNQHMVQIGSVDAAEINEVGRWLAELTRQHNLPQKVLMLHQFTVHMIANRPSLVTDYDELRVVIHADGFGSPGAKFNTWQNLHLEAPANVAWGWKNFIDEDQPTFSPQETMSVSPEIVFVSDQ